MQRKDWLQTFYYRKPHNGFFLKTYCDYKNVLNGFRILHIVIVKMFIIDFFFYFANCNCRYPPSDFFCNLNIVITLGPDMHILGL